MSGSALTVPPLRGLPPSLGRPGLPSRCRAPWLSVEKPTPGLSSADLVRLGLRWILKHPDVLLRPKLNP
jgi:hypothetical protein